MDNNVDNLKRLLDQIKTINFWQRIFGWKRIREQLTDASVDLQRSLSNYEHLREQYTTSSFNNTSQAETISRLSVRKNELALELAGLKEKWLGLQEEYQKSKQQNTQLLAEENNRRIHYEKEMRTLSSVREQIQLDRTKEVEERNQLEIERLLSLKETWARHQSTVKSVIKNICNKHTIEYLDSIPFKGDPDNTVKICDEFVIFDAKSPGAEDQANFPSYLKDQAEKAKKYARQDNVKPDIFFVIPSNTLENLNSFVYNLGDYNVYLISVDSLEQIILSLKKIEDYEFVQQLTPEERENICRVLGKFAHLTKRRIQIDSFFAQQFIELIYKTEASLPNDILEKMGEFERSEKLNPPIEKRSRAINIKELEKDAIKLSNDAYSKGIVIDNAKISNGLNDLQLYKPG